MTVSIIIPVLNQHSMTDQCIESIKRHTHSDYEIVIIDNGSNPPYCNGNAATIIRNDNNLGFPEAVNQGIYASTGDIICLLNNDTIVTAGWLDKMISRLDEYSIVGPMTGYVAGMQKAIINIYDDMEGFNISAKEWADKHSGQTQEVTFIVGFCMLFSRSLSDQIGCFDTTLWPCSGEEIDFCFRARESGYKIGIVKDVYIHHFGSKTFQDLENAGVLNYKTVCKECDNYLNKKWGKGFWNRQIAPITVDLSGVCLNLGCGYNKKENYINIDNRIDVDPDVICDVLAGLPYESNSVDRVRADDFLEHIPIGKTIQVINEIWRVLKPGGIFESLTPSTDGRGAFMDPTHVSFWNRHSWLYYSDDRYRNLYNIDAKFDFERIEDAEIVPGLGIIHTLAIGKAVK